MAVRCGCYLLGGGKVCDCEMGLSPAGKEGEVSSCEMGLLPAGRGKVYGCEMWLLPAGRGKGMWL